jgi:hypothetical protein
VRRYRYDSQGELLGPPDRLQIQAGQKLDVRVPKDGLTIVEIATPR